MNIILFAFIITSSVSTVVQGHYAGFSNGGKSTEIVREGSSGTCGELLWCFNDETSTLIISGDGDMECCGSSFSPWSILSEQVKHIEIQERVTSIDQFAFNGFTSLETVSISSNLTSIGSDAFSS